MADNQPPQSSIILYQTEDGRTRIQCRFEDDTIWLTQAQIAELFQTTPQNVTLHLKAIFAEGELTEASTCKDYLQVRQEGNREVTRSLRHYRLPAILAVGYRVRLRLNERAILPGAGKVTREEADAIAEQEYDRFAARRRARLEDEAEADTFKQLEDEVKRRPETKNTKRPKL